MIRSMIEVRAPLEIRADGEAGWELVFWVLDSFNYTTPFRAILAEIAEALGQQPIHSLSLSDNTTDEDFMEGTLKFDGGPLRVYYEHALSYLTLGSVDRELLTKMAVRVQPRVILV
ncbi:conserved hypothetical protein [Novosphingobium sp. 9U]|nr:conserved hypothetical protein [Novosphingobium sp. 9U]